MQLDPLHRKDNNLVNYGVLLVSGSDSDLCVLTFVNRKSHRLEFSLKESFSSVVRLYKEQRYFKRSYAFIIYK